MSARRGGRARRDSGSFRRRLANRPKPVYKFNLSSLND
ncbi:hypothetical protein C7S16_2056 [Burkholderia thailandensis]|uniref:Uncharacterized protein n=1 Tax=Burkholderia thailandensis TaxID=57975 RepID=A0AAW9CX46_BURTH|nr:hypothetical protein [Burkholderia thailandensis]MDW9255164.1 hypothetical protein [Burkholderia thailandensis]